MAKERPIIFSTEMVEAILDGRKTMTRRIVKKDSVGMIEVMMREGSDISGFVTYNCPYGMVGDRLWVRETWFSFPAYDNLKPSKIPHTESIESMHENDIDYIASPISYYNRGKKRPSIFMPRWASRIDLGITDIRVERVQDISEDDCYNEGCSDTDRGIIGAGAVAGEIIEIDEGIKDVFMQLWDSFNAKRGYGWEVNPWVWVIEVKGVVNG